MSISSNTINTINTTHTTIIDRVTILNSQLDDVVLKLQAIAPTLGIAINHSHPLQPHGDPATTTINLDGTLEECQTQADIANEIVDSLIEKIGINFDDNTLSVGTVIVNGDITSNVKAERVAQQLIDSRVRVPVIASKVATKKRAR
jgi:ketopantoate reductase